MLILQRKTNEGCVVGPIKIFITRINENEINLGIDAPHEFKIKRVEDFKSKDHLEQFCFASLMQLKERD